MAACLIDLEKAFDSVWLEGLFFKLQRKGFPTHIIKLLWNSFKDRTFKLINGNKTSDFTFNISDGLQQGTVNAPLLFNVYNSDILNLFGMNQDQKTHSIAFADDFIAYIAGKNPQTLARKIEDLINRIDRYYTNWHLKINPQKCETILFRITTHRLNRSERKNLHKFKIRIKRKNEEPVDIPHRTTVKYQGILVDYMVRMSEHPRKQLTKAGNAFLQLSKLFYNRNIESKAKIICYQLLIRPIKLYSFLSWFNQSASMMERLRTFERSCLRVCLRRARNPNFNYQRNKHIQRGSHKKNRQ